MENLTISERRNIAEEGKLMGNPDDQKLEPPQMLRSNVVEGGLHMEHLTMCERRNIAEEGKLMGDYQKLEPPQMLRINVVEGKGKQKREKTPPLPQISPHSKKPPLPKGKEKQKRDETPPLAHISSHSKKPPLPKVKTTSKLKQRKQPRRKQHEMNQSTRNWLDLPLDLMLDILSRVGVMEILWNVQVVCTRWHEICKSPSMWRVIYMDPDFYYIHRPYTWPSCLPSSFARSRKVAREMCKKVVVRSQGQLVDIVLVGFCDNEVLEYIADRSRQLRRLEIAYSHDDIGSGGLSKAFKKLPCLEEVSCYNTEILVDDIVALGSYCPMLKTLKLNENINVGDTSIIAISEHLSELRHLEIQQNFLSNTSLQAILDGCRHLQLLDLRLCLDIILVGDLRKRCLKQIKCVKLPNEPVKQDPYSDDATMIDYLTFRSLFY